MKMKFKLLISLIVALGFVASKINAEPIVIEEKLPYNYCNNYTEVLEDSDKKLNFKDIENSKLFKKGNSLNLGLTSSQIWMKLEIIIPENNSEKLFMVIANPKVDICEIFYPENGVYKSKIFGDNIPYFSTDRNSHLFNLEINSNPGHYNYYLRVKNRDWFVTPIFIFGNDSYEQFKSKTIIFDGFLYGILLIMFIYYLFITIATKDRTSLYFSMYVLSTLAYEFFSSGHFQEYFFQHGVLPDYVPYFWQMIGAGFFLFFFKTFIYLDQKKKTFILKILVSLGVLFQVLAFISILIPVEITVLINSLVSITVFLIVLCVSIYNLISRNI